MWVDKYTGSNIYRLKDSRLNVGYQGQQFCCTPQCLSPQAQHPAQVSPKVNDPTVCSAPSFLILSAIYFYCKYDCGKKGFWHVTVYSKEVLRQGKRRKKQSKKPAEKTNNILTEKEGLQRTFLDLMAIAVRPTASSSYVVIMTSPLPGNLSLLIPPWIVSRSQYPLQQGTKTSYAHIPRFEHPQEKRSPFSHCTLFL